jgi:peptide/nickel transport system ATP-binding protein
MKAPEHPIVAVENLSIDYKTLAGRVHAVQDVTFSLHHGEVLGLVGESGCGKSTVALALLGHLGSNGFLVGGRVLLQGESILTLPAALLAARRGRQIGFVPQDPTTALSPHLPIGNQYAEIVLHHGIAKTHEEATSLAYEQFSFVGLPDPPRLSRRYPHELSGGQQQRVCIAMAVACHPEVLVLDEPTTGLDVTTQARIVSLLRGLQAHLGMAMLYVTHDLALLGQIANRVGVMYAGRLVELGAADHLFAKPYHPYSRGLIASVLTLEPRRDDGRRLHGFLQRNRLPQGCPFFPRCDHAELSCSEKVQHLELVGPNYWVACQQWNHIFDQSSAGSASPPKEIAAGSGTTTKVLEIEDLSVSYGRSAWWRRIIGLRSANVVNDLSFSIAPGEIFALVGESGSGKSTTARAISGLLRPQAGTLRFRGESLPGNLRRRSLDLKRQIQFIFQNPDASLNPRERIRSILARPLRVFFRVGRAGVTDRLLAAIGEVHLEPSYVARFPDQLSGGERQRVAIARALVAQPSLILCDEILSSLDVSVQSSIIDLLARLRQETKVAMLFISHDLAVVRHLADRIGVLFGGTLVEYGATAALFKPPFHPYTEELLLAVPSIRRRGKLPPPASRVGHVRQRGQGCIYAGRCHRHLGSICDERTPPWREVTAGHAIRCHIPLSELATGSLIDPSTDTEKDEPTVVKWNRRSARRLMASGLTHQRGPDKRSFPDYAWE